MFLVKGQSEQFEDVLNARHFTEDGEMVERACQTEASKGESWNRLE
jgi:hypothetical protein